MEDGIEVPDGDIDVDMMVRDKNGTEVTCQPCVCHEAGTRHLIILCS